MRVLYAGMAALLAVSACSKGEERAGETAVVAETPAADRARRAALTANAIADHPAAADSILGAAGYTRDGYQKLMYEIAADSAMSAVYASARNK